MPLGHNKLIPSLGAAGQPQQSNNVCQTMLFTQRLPNSKKHKTPTYNTGSHRRPNLALPLDTGRPRNTKRRLRHPLALQKRKTQRNDRRRASRHKARRSNQASTKAQSTSTHTSQHPTIWNKNQHRHAYQITTFHRANKLPKQLSMLKLATLNCQGLNVIHKRQDIAAIATTITTTTATAATTTMPTTWLLLLRLL